MVGRLSMPTHCAVRPVQLMRRRWDVLCDSIAGISAIHCV
jgi:hypothetical protein